MIDVIWFIRNYAVHTAVHCSLALGLFTFYFYILQIKKTWSCTFSYSYMLYHILRCPVIREVLWEYDWFINMNKVMEREG